MAQAHQSRHRRNRRRRGVLLDASPIAAAAGVPVRRNGDVAELAGHANLAVENAPVDDNPAPDAGAERQQHQVVHAAPRAHPPFAQRGGVGVVFQDDFRVEPLAQFIAHRVAVENRHVAPADDHALGHIDIARHARADPDEVIAPELLAQLLDRLGHIVDDGSWPRRDGRAPRDFRQHLAVFVDRGGPQVRSAQIDPDGVRAHVGNSTNSRSVMEKK